MKIFRLKRKDRELFLDMDPLSMMERLEFPGAFALAAVMEKEDTGEDIPAGLAICIDSGNSIIIQWLCVAADHRRQGIGEQLLAAVFDAAVKLNYASVGAYINTEYGRELICAGEEGYLRDRLFTDTRPLAGEWVTSIGILKNIPILNSSTENKNVKVQPLGTLLSGQRREALHTLSGRKYAASLYPIEDKLRYLDMDVSCLIYEKGELSGGLLVQSVERITTQLEDDGVRNYTEKVLYPVYMCIESSAGMKILLAAALEAADEKYKADSEVHILMNKGHYAQLMERILPGSRIAGRLLVASVEDYKRQDVELELQMLLSLG